MRRPLCVFILISAVLVFLTVTFGKTLSLFLIPVISLAFIIVLPFYIKYKKTSCLLLLTCLVISLFSLLFTTFLHLPKLESAKSLDGEFARVEGKIISSSKGDNYSSFVVESGIENTDFKNCNVTLILPTKCAENIDIGKYISFSGTLEYSDDTFSKGRESFLTVFTSEYKILDNRCDFLGNLVYSLRKTISDVAENFDSGAIIKALIIGDKSGLGPETVDNFSTLGISHVLAISGLHLSVVAMSIYLLLNRLGVGLHLSSFVSSFLALFYMLVTGFTLSVVRAGQMMIIFFLSRNIRRKSDSITALFFSGFLIIMFSPWSIFNLGFQLSFLSTFGLLVFLPPVVNKHEKFLRRFEKKIDKEKSTLIFKIFRKLSGYVVVSVYSTLSATILTLPVTLSTFNEFSLFSIVSNLVVVFLIKYLLSLSIIVVITGAFKLSFLSGIIGFFNNVLYSSLLYVTTFLADISPTPISLNSTFLVVGIIFVLAIVTISLFFSKSLLTTPITAVAITLFILFFNFVCAKVLYSSFVIDTVVKRTCNTSFVKYNDKTYLLDLTDSNSKAVSSIISLAEKRKYREIDNVVFVSSSKIPTDRLEVLASAFAIKNVTLHMQNIEPEELIFFSEFCEEKDISFKFVPTENCVISEGISTINLQDLCTALIISKGENSLTIYKDLTKGYREPSLVNTGKVIYTKSENGKPNNFVFSCILNEKRVIE